MEQELELLRKKALRKQLIFLFGFIGAGIIIGLVTRVYHLMFAFVVLSIVLSSFITNKDVKKFRTMFKENVVVAALNKICTDIKFDMNRGMDRSIIAATHMMDMGDNFYSNDYVEGKYKNINFEMSDIHIERETTDSDGNTHTYTIFRGQWYIFDFNKYFKANVQVCSKNFGNATRGTLFAKKEERYKKVELEDIEFNKEFRVYAQNELDAFYILTPNTMERIKTASNEIKGRLLFCFIDNKLHIGLYNNKDFFEASLYKKVNLEKSTEQTNEEIKVITNFVDILSLDNDLFK